MISAYTTGSRGSMDRFLRDLRKINFMNILHKAGEDGVRGLSSATPLESGLASQSWGYEIEERKGVYTLTWTNTDVEDGFPVVIMLQYGYATGTGGYVQGVDFINPTMKPIFDKIADEVWKAVTSA